MLARPMLAGPMLESLVNVSKTANYTVSQQWLPQHWLLSGTLHLN